VAASQRDAASTRRNSPHRTARQAAHPHPFQNPSRAVVRAPRPPPRSPPQQQPQTVGSRSHGTRRSQRPSTRPHAPIRRLASLPNSKPRFEAAAVLSKTAGPPEINPPTTRSLGNYTTRRQRRSFVGGGAATRGGGGARGECAHEMIPQSSPPSLPLRNHAALE
jgi:hypothetical protein